MGMIAENDIGTVFFKYSKPDFLIFIRLVGKLSSDMRKNYDQIRIGFLSLSEVFLHHCLLTVKILTVRTADHGGRKTKLSVDQVFIPEVITSVGVGEYGHFDALAFNDLNPFVLLVFFAFIGTDVV